MDISKNINSKINVQEYENIFKKIISLSEEMKDIKEKEKELKVSNAIVSLSRQVSHDIKSPIAALDMIVNLINDDDQVDRSLVELLKSATGRIKDISNNLTHTELSKNESSKELISIILEELVSEKKIEYKKFYELNINLSVSHESYFCFCEIRASDLNRILSNLINNSFESFNGGKGNIDIKLEKTDDYLSIALVDDGCGIPKKVLEKVTQEGFSYGKENSAKSGTGLGLHHAKQCIEKWDGKIIIESNLGVGTKINIVLPTVKTPKWFCEKIYIKRSLLIVDDDLLIHDIWKKRLKDQSIEIESSFNPINNIDKEFDFYIVDYEFKGFNENGIDFIKRMNISDKSVLSTSVFKDKDIQKLCERERIKILPKSIINQIELNLSHA